MTENSRVILITGCSSGIGRALAEHYSNSKIDRVVVTARKKSIASVHLLFKESENFLIRELDITEEESIANLVSEIYSKWQALDVIINNAGICYRSVVEHMDEFAEIHQIQTNYLGPMSLIRAVLPAMRERCRGHIINISSVSGTVAMPTMGSYCASKSALNSASESLWYEVKPFGIHVSVVQPGFVRSPSFQKTYQSKKAQLSENLGASYSEYYIAFSKFIEKLMYRSSTRPSTIVRKIVRLMERRNPPLWVPVGLDAYLFKLMKQILPQRFFNFLMFKMLPEPAVWLPRDPILPDIIIDL